MINTTEHYGLKKPDGEEKVDIGVLMLDWRKHKLESRLPGEILITSDMQMTPPLWQKVKK